MTEQITTEAMNKVIAVLDGWQFVAGDPTHKCSFCFAGDDPCTPAADRFIKEGEIRFHYELKYHSDWEWLMRVWYKFVDLKFPDPMKQFKHSELKTTIGYAILYGSIKIAHGNIFEGIQWLNKQQ